MTLNELEKQVAPYSDINRALTDTVREMEDEIAAIRRKYTPIITEQAVKAKEIRAELAEAIESAPELFVKPRTQTIYGIKFGLKKNKGKLIASDRTLELLKKHLPDAPELIRVKEEPDMKAIAFLSANELKRIGVTVTSDTDEVVISSDFDKIEKLIKDLVEDEA
jgi:phage host-nuclease inhibitor protein Gam